MMVRDICAGNSCGRAPCQATDQGGHGADERVRLHQGHPGAKVSGTQVPLQEARSYVHSEETNFD